MTPRTVHASGSALDEIDREAQALDASLLVRGARGAGDLRRLVLGSTSERLLLLNAYQVPFDEKLHFAGVDAATIDRCRQQARADATRRVHELAVAAGLRSGDWEPWIVEGEASQRIVEHEQERERDCDLVVLGKHGQSAAEDLLLGSISKHVRAEGSPDVLVSTARDA